MNNVETPPPPAGLCWLMGGREQESIPFGVPFNVYHSHSLGDSTDGGSAVVELEWGAGTYGEPI